MGKEQDYYKQVANTLIESLRAGTPPWRKSWTSVSAFPTNPTTGKRYKGCNLINLMMQGHQDPRWMTYNQAENEGASVKKGEHGTPIIFWRFEEKQPVLKENGAPELDKHGNPVKITVQLERPRPFVSIVFNAEQIEGLPPLVNKELTWKPVERAERLMTSSGANIVHDACYVPCYQPREDKIELPHLAQFTGDTAYYATAFHELAHWTGHESRMNREDLYQANGTMSRALEELRAEIAGMMISGEVGIPNIDLDNHAAYVESWIKALEDDPKEIFRAAADAERILNYIMGLEQKQEQQVEQDVEQLISQTEAAHQETKLDQQETKRQYLNVPFAEKEQAKALGAKWDRQEKAWYIPSGVNEDAFTKWLSAAHDTQLEAEPIVGQSDVHFGLCPVRGLCLNMTDSLAWSWLDENNNEVRYSQDLGHIDADTLKSCFGDDTAYYGTITVHEASKIIADGYSVTIDSWGANNEKTHPLYRALHAEEDISLDKSFEVKSQASSRTIEHKASSRQHLAVPYNERYSAKEAGARWDAVAKSWYVGPDADMDKLKKWSPGNRPEQLPAMQPHEEFAEALRSLGFRIDGEHPIMDGKTHRIEVEDDRGGEKAGFYVGHMDGRPAGYAKNNRTGDEIRWKSSGPMPSIQDKEAFLAECAVRRQERESQLKEQFLKTAQRISYQMNNLAPVTEPSPYMQAKGIQVHKGALQGENGTICLPAMDAEGHVWSMQYVNSDGIKRYAKESQKEGCFHPVDGMGQVLRAPALVICEGYATASSVAESIGFATIAAFDSGNVISVAKALHEKYPDKPIVIAGDDDRAIKVNAGRIHAEQAAKEVGGIAVFPTFAPHETGRDFTDFNDLGTKSILGAEAVKRQVMPAVDQAVRLKSEEKQQQQQNRQASRTV